MAALVVISAAVAPAQPAEDREWKDASGRMLKAALLGVERDTALLRLPGGQRSAIALEKLSGEDRAWIDQWKANRSTELALPPANWPRVITQPLPQIDGPTPEDGGFTFQTAHYCFVADADLSVAAVRDFATVAEATWKVLHQWPLPAGINDRADRTGESRLTARIFRNRAEYEAAGGPADSAGFFTRGFGTRGALLVPFESLGIEKFQGRFTKGSDYQPRILIHELTHQIYSDFIPLFPLWINEGLAEFVALAPYHEGTFRLEPASLQQALRRRIDEYRRRDPAAGGAFGPGEVPTESWTVSLDDLFEIDRTDPELRAAGLAEKHRVYFTSLLTVYYFLLFDGDGGARRLRGCFEDARRLPFRRRGWAGGDHQLPAGWTRDDLSRPKIREKMTAKLLDGRNSEALQTEMRTKFRRLGLPVEFPRAN